MTRTIPQKTLIFIGLAALVGGLMFGGPGCGDYKPCETLARKICTECPHLETHWEAACLCIENNSLKERGYLCLPGEYQDKFRCHSDLENWNEDTCDQLN